MPTPVDKLTTGIRLRHVRSVEQALHEGASPNADVALEPNEQFSSTHAPVLYLAIHHDFPEAIRLLVCHGADLRKDCPQGLTPRVHAAWRLRWECLDAFDEATLPAPDDDLVLSAIVSHWAEPAVGRCLEQVFFRRLDRAAPGFSMTPDLAMCFVVGVLFGWEGYRVPQLRQLVAHDRFQCVGRSLRPAVHAAPQRFAPHYAKMHSQARRITGERAVPDPALEVMIEYDIPLAPPAQANLEPEANAWLCEQQSRADALACHRSLQEGTPQAQDHGAGKGRL